MGIKDGGGKQEDTEQTGDWGHRDGEAQGRQPQVETDTCRVPSPSWRAETRSFWTRDVETLEVFSISGANGQGINLMPRDARSSPDSQNPDLRINTLPSPPARALRPSPRSSAGVQHPSDLLLSSLPSPSSSA